MIKIKLVLLLSCTSNIVLLTKADDEVPIEYVCNPNIVDIMTDSPILNLKEYCKDSKKPCVSKCCKRDEVLHTKTVKNGNETTKLWPVCTSSSSLGINDANYTILKIYGTSIEQDNHETTKNFLKDFNLVQNRMFENETCVYAADWIDPYLLEDGTSALNMIPLGGTWIVIQPEYFCVDLNVIDDSDQVKEIFYIATEKSQEKVTKRYFVGIALQISSAFLILVLLVYCVLPQLRNLSGMLLMAYVASQCLTYVLLSVLTLFTSSFEAETVAIIAEIFYFACLSSLCWLNIMSFDIWWTFRGQRLKRRINRRGELVKFGWYSLYGWGAPLAVTVMAILIDKYRDNMPHIVAPMFDTNFRMEKSSTYYIHVPMGFVILINVVLFFMTIYNIWLIKKKLNTFSDNSNSTIKNENRLWLYVKMSMLMGISWLIEVGVSLYSGELPTWAYILINLYNALIGVIIFIMFVMTKKTLKLLCKRFNCRWSFLEDKKFSPNKRSTTKSTTTEGSCNRSGTSGTYESDVEMDDVEVNTNPNPKIK